MSERIYSVAEKLPLLTSALDSLTRAGRTAEVAEVAELVVAEAKRLAKTE